jgi:hypothetical protein
MIRNTRGTMLLRSARRDPVIRCQRPGPHIHTPLTCGNASYRPLASAVMSDCCSSLLTSGTRTLSDADRTRMITSQIDAAWAVARRATAICDRALCGGLGRSACHDRLVAGTMRA